MNHINTQFVFLNMTKKHGCNVNNAILLQLNDTSVKYILEGLLLSSVLE